MSKFPGETESLTLLWLFLLELPREPRSLSQDHTANMKQIKDCNPCQANISCPSGCHLPVLREIGHKQVLLSSPNQIPSIRNYIYSLFLLVTPWSLEKVWMGRGLCFILWSTSNNWDFLSSLPPCLCLPFLTYTRAHTLSPQHSHTSLSLRFKKSLSSSEWIDLTSPMTEQACPPSNSVRDKSARQHQACQDRSRLCPLAIA